jgi:hypothetical protein
VKKALYTLSIVILGFVQLTFGQDDNQKCIKCHGQTSYVAISKDSTQHKNCLMSKERRIDTARYAKATHGKFSCTDCHDEGYTKVPHDGELKFTEMLNCMDCHGGNKKFKKYNFETIETEAQKSVHYVNSKEFNCYKCHDPHTFKNTFTQNNSSSKASIDVCNEMCGSCHNNPDKLSLLTKKKLKSFSEAHAWLPESDHHMQNLRCTDCHGEINNNIASMHNILPASKAVRNCSECHSVNSRLTTTLYKFNSKNERKKYGFFNSAIMNNAYVIGATRNQYFNILSFLLFAGIIAMLLGHYTLLKISRKKNKKDVK